MKVSSKLNDVIDRHTATALIDIGADYRALWGMLSCRLRKVMTPWDGQRIRTTGGQLITPVERCAARIEIHGEKCPLRSVVLNDLARSVLLRMNFPSEYGAVIDVGANKLPFRKPLLMPDDPETTSDVVRLLGDHVNLPPC